MGEARHVLACEPPGVEPVKPERLEQLRRPTPVAQDIWRFLLRWRYRLFHRHRFRRLVLESVAGRPILVLPQVFNPKLHRTGEFLVDSLDERLIPPGSTVLDMGTGSGVGAVFAARWARQVVAVDINPEAVRCAHINVLLNQVEDRVEVRLGDLFEPVRLQAFDVVLFNPPYYKGTPRDDWERSWRGVGVVERFARELSRHLSPHGHALLDLSTDGDERSFVQLFRERDFTARVVAERHLVNETLRLYQLSRAQG